MIRNLESGKAHQGNTYDYALYNDNKSENCMIAHKVKTHFVNSQLRSLSPSSSQEFMIRWKEGKTNKIKNMEETKR